MEFSPIWYIHFRYMIKRNMHCIAMEINISHIWLTCTMYAIRIARIMKHVPDLLGLEVPKVRSVLIIDDHKV